MLFVFVFWTRLLSIQYCGGGDFRNFEPVYTTRSWSMSRIDKIIRQLRRIYKDNPSYFEVPAFAQKVY